MSDVTLIVKSEYGDTVAVITNGTNRGAIVGIEYEEERMGGVTSATFCLAEGSDVPLYTGMNVLLQVDGNPMALFDVDGNPDNRGAAGVVEVKCKGLSERLKKVMATGIFEGISLKAACLALAPAASTAGIVIDEADIALPSDVTVGELDAEGENLYDLIETLLTYANGAGSVDKYAWKIDPNKHLVIYNVSLIPVTTMYEGYGFQSPDPEVSNSDMVNRIELWRKASSGDVSEYVDTYSDAASIDKYGLFETRIDLDYYAATADCALIAGGILARHAKPSRTITLSSLPGITGFGDHRLFLRPMNVWQALYAGENKSVLELSHASGTHLSDDTTSLIGRFSTKCELNPGAFGYIALPVFPAVILPQRVRLFIKGTVGAECRIILVDVDGDTAQAVMNCDGTWKQLTIPLDDSRRTKYALTLRSSTRLHDISEEEAPEVFIDGLASDDDEYENIFSSDAEASVFDLAEATATDYTVELNNEEDGEHYALFMPARGSITTLAEIRFQWITTGVSIWIDYVDCVASQWQAETIGVSKVKAKLEHDSFISEVEFGDGVRTAADELTDVWSVLRGKR